MNRHTRKVIREVEEIYYTATDGTEFSSESACKNYEDRKNGTRKTCPDCNGNGYTLGAYHEAYHNYDIGHVDAGHYRNHCARCNGRGYLELKWE
jgi:DnaJ-class molecular chaperone